VEENKAVEIRVVRLKNVCPMHSVEIVNVGGNLHLWAQAVFHDPAKRVVGGTFWERELAVTVGHALGSNKNKVNYRSRKQV
jgi:hypothetical protein